MIIVITKPDLVYSIYLLSDAVHAGIPATGFLILIPMSKWIIIPLE